MPSRQSKGKKQESHGNKTTRPPARGRSLHRRPDATRSPRR